MHRIRRLLGLLAVAPAVAANIIVLNYTDPRITYLGSGFVEQAFLPPLGTNPVNDSSCAYGQNGTTTGFYGDSFSFTFHGIAVSLIMASGDVQGVYNITLDGQRQQVSGYTDSDYCGPLWKATGLDVSKQHLVQAAYVARASQSSSETQFMTLFAIIFDTGGGPDNTDILTTPTLARSTLHVSPTVGTGSVGPPVGATVGASSPGLGHGANIGAIAGGAAAGLVAGIALACLYGWLCIRKRRQRADGEKLESPTAPDPWTPPPRRVHATRSTRRPGPRASLKRQGSARSLIPTSPSAETTFTGAPWSEPDVERVARRVAQLVEARRTYTEAQSQQWSMHPPPY